MAQHYYDSRGAYHHEGAIPAGLEVVLPGGIEVAKDPNHEGFKYAVQADQLSPGPPAEHGSGRPTSPLSQTLTNASPFRPHSNQQQYIPIDTPQAVTEPQKKSKRKVLFLAVAVLGALLAGVVGGIAGWQVTEAKYRGYQPATSAGGSSETCPSPPPADPSAAEGAAAAVRRGSALAATGFYYGDDFEVRLFYQDPSGRARFSKYDTVTNAWDRPVTIAGNAAVPRINTSIAASIIRRRYLKDNTAVVQYQLLYVDSNMKIVGHNFRDGQPVAGFPSDGLADADYSIAGGSQLASLWPAALYQETNKAGRPQLTQSYYNLTGGSGQTPAYIKSALVPQGDAAAAADADVEMAAGSALLALPQSAAARGDGVRVFYRNGNGRLAGLVRDGSGGAAGTAGPQVDGGGAAAEIPADSPLAGFAWASGGGDGLATVLLWRAADGKVRFVRRDAADSAWSAPATDAVFDSINPDSGLACSATSGVSTETLSIRVSDKDGLNLCFFQQGDTIRQVWYNAATSKWVAKGVVTMPA